MTGMQQAAGDEVAALTEKIDAAGRAHATTADEVQRLGRAQRGTDARLTLVEETLAMATATARVAMQTAIELRADVQRSLHEVSNGISERLEALERTVVSVGATSDAPLVRRAQDRTARYAAIASAFGTGLAYAIAELIRHFSN
jgi:hypothetical protein